MAVRYAVQSGNWSDPATWDGGTLPDAGDDVYADGKTVTVDQDINVGSLHTDAREGGTAGGTFTVSVASGQTRTITCTGPEPNVVAGSSHCITISTSVSGDATVITNCSPRGGTSSQAYGINKTSACGYQHAGNCYTGLVTASAGVVIAAGSNNVINGNAYGTTGGVSAGFASGAVSVTNAGVTAQVFGDMYGGASCGLHVFSGGTCTLNGNVYGGGSQAGAYMYNNGRLTVNGNVYGHATNSGVAGCTFYDSSGLLILNGDAVAQAGPAVNGNTGGRVVVNGDLIPTDSNYAVTNVSLELRGTSYTSASGRPGFGALYVFGISSTGNSAVKVKYYDAENNMFGAEDTLATSTTYGNLYPSAADVRYGVSYGPANQWTGTAYIPAPASVAYGVPVDNTTGTAVLTQQAAADAVWNELRSAHTTTGTFGAVSEWAGGGGGGITAADVWSYATRTLTSAAGITSDGSAIDQTKIANLDAAVSSRLASASYVAPDNTSISAIKTQTDKLQFDASNRIIADAQAISASTTAADALEANVANLDAAVSSRLAATAYVSPPTEANIWSYATRTLTAFAFPVTVGTNNDKTGYSLTSDYDRAKTALATTEYAAPDNASVAAIKAQTDKLQFNASNRVLADATATVDIGAVADAVWDEPRSQHVVAGSFGAVAEWASASSGTGARTIVVTVNDGTNPLESATVRMTKGAESYVAKTNSGGQATFYLDDGTWIAVATLAGYNGASTTHVVDATQSPLTISLTRLALTPSPPGTVTGYAVVLDERGAPEPGVTCSSQLVYAPSGSGVVGDTTAQVSVSDPNGVIQFTGLLPGGIYKFSRGSQFVLVSIPTNATDPWQIVNFGGAP